MWIDADRNGRRDSAYEYAKAIVDSSKGDVNEIIKSLATYDEAVAAQAAALLWRNEVDLNSPEVSAAVMRAAPATKTGFGVVIAELRLILK